MKNEDENNNDKETSTIARLLAILILAGFFAAVFYCTATIYKGIIREAIVEAIEQTKTKL